MLQHATITGVDHTVSFDALHAMVRRDRGTCDLALGVHYNPEKMGQARYPTTEWILSFLQFAATENVETEIHLSEEAIAAYADPQAPVHHLIKLFDRTQINAAGIQQYDLAPAIDRRIQQSQTDVITRHWIGARDLWYRLKAANHRVLIDSSGGRGLIPREWPMQLPEKTCGYAGGLDASNIRAHLQTLHSQAVGRDFWVNIETGVRDDADNFSVGRASGLIDALRDASCRCTAKGLLNSLLLPFSGRIPNRQLN